MEAFDVVGRILEFINYILGYFGVCLFYLIPRDCNGLEFYLIEFLCQYYEGLIALAADLLDDPSDGLIDLVYF